MKNVDAGTARAAVEQLPRALAQQLRTPDTHAAPLRFAAAPSPAALSERLAQHLAARLRTQRSGGK